jgi:hypothetical protein
MVAGGVTESAAVIVDESEMIDIRLLQSTAWAAPQMPSVPPINTAPNRSMVRAVSNLVIVVIDPPGWMRATD